MNLWRAGRIETAATTGSVALAEQLSYRQRRQLRVCPIYARRPNKSRTPPRRVSGSRPLSRLVRRASHRPSRFCSSFSSLDEVRSIAWRCPLRPAFFGLVEYRPDLRFGFLIQGFHEDGTLAFGALDLCPAMAASATLSRESQPGHFTIIGMLIPRLLQKPLAKERTITRVFRTFANAQSIAVSRINPEIADPFVVFLRGIKQPIHKWKQWIKPAPSKVSRQWPRSVASLGVEPIPE